MEKREIIIRSCEPGDTAGVSEVCCRTGYGGEDITRSRRFRDRRLFAMLFCRYYLRYERETSFVVVPRDEPRRVVGYVLGSTDTERYERGFARRMIPRIALRTLFVTSWRYPRTLIEMLRWGRGVPWREANPAGRRFPAHLHIDILPEFQRQGVGGRLLDRLETRFRDLGVPGIHLVTSSEHRSALPFYEKHGYRRIREREHRMWSGLSPYRSIVYVKELGRGPTDEQGRSAR